MLSVEIQIGCGGITEIGWYPCHDEYGIFLFVRGFGYSCDEAMDVVRFVRGAQDGEEYENGSMRVVVEDE